jgi:diaminohydroxyphosphoribosylaminopyrimidine deaminase / 5-amino-6-(5-phosphoribosylamino)uracil reductase
LMATIDYMARALELAELARGATGNNPPVGAVIVRDGRVVGEGYTQPPGQAHAEVIALRSAGELARGATLYVTLEPCCHHGRTPPCADALIGAGVGEVHMAVLDPNPLVCGGGKTALERAGIRTIVGAREQEARRTMEAWLTYIATGRPMIIAKYAMSLDGKIATATGESQWISGPRARQWVHGFRSRVDAIMVGVNTVIADDPQLTARDLDGNPLPRQPARIIVDSTARVPLRCRAVSGELPGKTVLIVGPRADRGKVARLQEWGNAVIAVPERNGRVDVEAALRGLAAEWHITSVLVEGGGALIGSLFDLSLVDKVVAFIAPKLIGGVEAPGPVGGHGVEAIKTAIRLQNVEWEPVGDDMMVTGYVERDVHGNS